MTNTALSLFANVTRNSRVNAPNTTSYGPNTWVLRLLVTTFRRASAFNRSMKSLMGGMYCSFSGYRLSSTAMSMALLLEKIAGIHAPRTGIPELGIESADGWIREEV